MNAGILLDIMSTAKKVTVHLPEELLKRARATTQQGITSTIRRGLEILAASKSYEELRRLKGRIKFSINVKKLRKDR